MAENKINEDEGKEIEALNNGKLYLVTATLTGEENGKKMSFDVHSYIIVPSSANQEQIENAFKNQIHLDKDDKISFRMVKTGEVFQFLGYNDNHKLEEGLNEGDVFTFKRCGLEYIETFEKAPGNDGVGWLFKPFEIGMFPPPKNPFFDEASSETINKKDGE